jgi:hypothetical protein
MYAAQEATGADAAGAGAADADASADEGDVVDAEFEEVKDDAKP